MSSAALVSKEKKANICPVVEHIVKTNNLVYYVFGIFVRVQFVLFELSYFALNFNVAVYQIALVYLSFSIQRHEIAGLIILVAV